MAARRKGSAGAPRLWPTQLGLFALRAFTGLVFVDAIYYKLWVTRMSKGGLGLSLFDAFEHTVEHPPVLFGWEMRWYSSFLDNVLLPGAVPYVVGPAILVFELLLGISLCFGIGVRLMAFLGALLMLAFGMAKNMYFFTVTGTNWILMMVLLFFALSGAGRVWGLDAKLRGKWPGWIS
jgi:uncharacterized membrane protein YphA (DoxX/SURF4 family)